MLKKILVTFVLGVMCMCSTGWADGSWRENSMSLNGPWQFVLGDGNERAETPAQQAKLRWQPITLPGRFMKPLSWSERWDDEPADSPKFAWAKRGFQLSSRQAQSVAILQWNKIDFGAVAFINGQKVGENAPTGPYQVMIPSEVLRPGENEIVLKIPSSAGVRKGKSGYFLIPAGFASERPRGIPQVLGDIWLDFADQAYFKWALAIPDVVKGEVRFKVTPAGPAPLDGLRVTATVTSWPEGSPLGTGEAPVRVKPDPDPLGGESFLVAVPVPRAKPWTPDEPNLCSAEITLSKDGKLLDTLSFRFGMREIETKDGRYLLNGKSLWLRGSNLVGEWNWTDNDWIVGRAKQYVVDEAREMSMNSFRTHTQPMPEGWADICDEYGTMVLAEFCKLHNRIDFNFTPEETAIYHRNCLTDAAGWMSRLWNHPSVVMWVLSNEPPGKDEWETGPYRDFVLALDPTRPTMRSGAETREILDIHLCDNTWRTAEGELIASIPSWFEMAEGRVVTNSEYMNSTGYPITQWTGTEDDLANRLVYAQLGMEHTEAMRRARMAGIWPYMYAGWTKTRHNGKQWKAGYAQPVSAAWHSALSPVLASLDLFNPNYLTDQQVTTELYLINDSWQDAKIHVDLLLTKENPEFIPEAECFSRPVAKWSYDYELKADSLQRVPVTWKLPEQEGQYWLTARTTGIPGRPVLSQRVVRAITAPASPKMTRTIVLLGGDAAAGAYLRSKGLSVSDGFSDLRPSEDMVLIWNADALAPDDKSSVGKLSEFASAGGRIVVLSASVWSWPELCDITIPKPPPYEWMSESFVYSRVFPYAGANHPLLSGVLLESLMRWNGLPGTVALAPLQGPAIASGTNILWARQPDQDHVIMSEVPARRGGTILFSQLDIRSHLDEGSQSYDPAAEKMLLNMLAP